MYVKVPAGDHRAAGSKWSIAHVISQKTSEELAAIQEIPVRQAEELVYQTLHEIVEAFRNMDDILAEINRKNTQYQGGGKPCKVSAGRGRKMSEGQMKEILLYIWRADGDRASWI